VFGIGMTELLVILVVGLLVLGPKRLPDLARSLGRGLAEFRRASTDMRREFMDVQDELRIDPTQEDSAPRGEEAAADPKPAEVPAETTAEPADPKHYPAPEQAAEQAAEAADSLDPSGDKASETAGG
jgi:Tat protein translocase TatB subunit